MNTGLNVVVDDRLETRSRLAGLNLAHDAVLVFLDHAARCLTFDSRGRLIAWCLPSSPCSAHPMPEVSFYGHQRHYIEVNDVSFAVMTADADVATTPWVVEDD